VGLNDFGAHKADVDMVVKKQKFNYAFNLRREK
jgi:hypothetical protein